MDTSIDALVAHCQGARFTGILRMRAREGIGEVWFLSGIADEIHFGVSTADEAMDRMRKASDPMYELVSRLPHPSGGFKRSFPSKGSVATATPVTLMRYCERYALTCTLEIEGSDVLIEAKYELGQLVSVETTADDDAITTMLEATEGTYAFALPRVELPAGTPVLPPTSSLSDAPPESLGFRAFLEAKPLVGRAVSDEAEVKRKTVEIARQQKAAAAAPPAKKPVEIVVKKEEPKPVEDKPVTPAPPPTPPAPAATPAIKKDAPKPVEAKPVTTAKPAPTPAPAPTATPRSVPPRPASKPETREKEKPEAKPEPAAADAIKEDAKPAAAADAIKEDEKPVAVAPLVEDKPLVTDKPDDEQATAPKDDEPAPDPDPVKPAKRRKKKRRSAEPPPEEAPPAKRSLTWLVVPLLCAAAVAYLVLTHRI